jgi:hypothetical protein
MIDRLALILPFDTLDAFFMFEDAPDRPEEIANFECENCNQPVDRMLTRFRN